MIKIKCKILLAVIPAEPIRMFALPREHKAQKACYKKRAISDFYTENTCLTTSAVQSGCLQVKKATSSVHVKVTMALP